MSPSEATQEVLADPEALAQRVADWILELANAKNGVFSVALSGGSTPRRLYKLLGASPRCNAFPWSRTHWFWGDERFVPYDDIQNNYYMTCEAMLSHAPIPKDHIHPIPTDGITPEISASLYEKELKTFYGADSLEVGRPLFDVVLLGLGTDGHTASLFPNTQVLTQRNRWVAPVINAKSETRITLTYPTLESCRYMAFLVTGADKRGIFNRLQKGDTELPAARVQPAGELIWFVDAATASGLSS